MDPFVVALAELCRTERTRAKWVILPSHALGHTVGERLAFEGTSWLNLRFATPLDLALQMAAPFLVERGIDPAMAALGPAVIMRLLLDLPATTPRYFRDLAEQPKLAEALWATLREVRMAALTSADLTPDAFTSAEKHAELRALLVAYETYLEIHRLADAASVYREAIEHLEMSPVLPQDMRIELPGVIWAPLEQELLGALPGIRLAAQSLKLPGLVTPRRLGTPEAALTRSPELDSDLLAFVMKPADSPQPLQDGSLTMFRAGGKEAEVEEVLRRILGAPIPFDQVEVAYASSDHATLFWEKAQRHDWPVTLAGGLPITVTRPARALGAFCSWIEGGFPAGGLRRLLQSGDIRVDLPDGPTAGQAARLLAQSDATWGRETYGAAMTALAASLRERATDAAVDDEARARHLGRAAHAERLVAWIARLLELVPEPDAEGGVRLDALVDGCAGFLGAYAAKSSEMDGAAARVLGEALAELRALRTLERPLTEAFRLIRHQVEGLAVGSDRARPGHLFVTPLYQAGYAGRPWTFVVGLEEGRVLPVPLEDPILLDAERHRLAPVLATSADRVAEALHTVVSRLAALGGHVCLSFSCRDLRQHRETFPSWLLLQALRVLKPGRYWTYQELNRELGEPVSVVPGWKHALSEAGWWLANLSGVGSSGLPAVHAAFPWLAQGEVAEAARESDAFTVYDGFVREAGSTLDPRLSGRPVAATTLENLARCPFRHFLERGLGLEPIEDAEPDRDQWLDPATRGVALHALYAAILRELRGQPVDASHHAPRLHELGQAKLTELRFLIPPPSAAVFDREAQEMLDDLGLFLRLRADERDRVPVGFEVAFGGGSTEGEPLAQLDPVMIDLGAGIRFRLRGRIDRVDRLADGSYEVIDYKTGRYRPGDYAGTFARGRLLQHALYGLAAADLLHRHDPGARISASAYFHPTVRGEAARIVFPPPPRDRVAAVLRDLFDILSSGAFVHTPDRDDCRWCELGRACGRDPSRAEAPLARSKRKLAAEENTALAPYLRLLQHD